MGVKKITMKDIAKKAEVSISCVARYINKSGYVSEEKMKRIEQVMEQLHYIPNQQAKGFRDGKSKLIGHIHKSSEENIFFSKMAEAIGKEGFARGYQTISVAFEGDNIEAVEQQMMALLTCRVDGIILNPGTDGEIAINISEWAKKYDIPLVMIERTAEIFEIDKILVDNAEGSYLATNILIAKGHSKIAYLGVEVVSTVEKERYYGYVQAMKQVDERYAKENSYFVKRYFVEDGYQKCMEILDKMEGRLPTAIFVASDILAAGVLRALSDKNISVPEQISVVGYDDTIARFLSPPLSTLRLPLEEIASAAVGMLIDSIGQEESLTTLSKKMIKIGPTYKERKSVRELQ